MTLSCLVAKIQGSEFVARAQFTSPYTFGQFFFNLYSLQYQQHQDYPQRMRLQRRLYGIFMSVFYILDSLIVFFFAKSLYKPFTQDQRLNLIWEQSYFNPIKAGGSESMYSLGGSQAPPPSRKRPQKICLGLKCMFIAQFFKVSLLEKNYTDNFNSLGAWEGLKK